MKNVQRVMVCCAITLACNMGMPSRVHAAGGGSNTADVLTGGTTFVGLGIVGIAVGVVVVPIWLVSELGTTIYYGGAWLTSSSLAGGGSGPQGAFVMAHRHELQAALVLDPKGVLRDLSVMYYVPVEAQTRFAREIRRHRSVLGAALGASSLKQQLPLIHATLLQARQVAMRHSEERP